MFDLQIVAFCAYIGLHPEHSTEESGVLELGFVAKYIPGAPLYSSNYL